MRDLITALLLVVGIIMVYVAITTPGTQILLSMGGGYAIGWSTGRIVNDFRRF